MGKAAARLYGGRAWVQMIALAIPFYLWILLMILQVVEEGLMYVGWSVLFGFFAYGTGIRADMREKYGINGNMFEDFFAVLLTYPFAAVQMDEHMEIQAMLRNGDAEFGREAVPNGGENEGYLGYSAENFDMAGRKAPPYEPAMVMQYREGKENTDEHYKQKTFL